MGREDRMAGIVIQPDGTALVWLPDESYARAIVHGVMVRYQRVRLGSVHSNYSEPDPVRQYQNHCWGSLGENAVEYLLQQLGHPVTRVYSFEGGSLRPDVAPNVQVRWSRNPSLRILASDNFEHLHFLVTGDQPFRVWGYLTGAQARHNLASSAVVFLRPHLLNRNFKEAPCPAPA